MRIRFMTAHLPRFLRLLLAALIGVTALAACQSIDTWQRGLIYRPTTTLDRTPDSVGVHFQEVWISTPAAGQFDAGRVHGWWMPAKQADAPALLFLHGNAGNLSYNLPIIERLGALGFSVLAIDYRGYGRSDAGVPDEPALYADAQAAWHELARLAPRATRRLIYGHSLGGAIAIDLAARVSDAHALVVESTFTSMADMADRRGYGWLPVSLILTQRFDSRDKIAQVRIPKLIIHGERDGMVPVEMGRALYDAARDPKELLVVPDARHSNVGSVAGERWRAALRRVAGVEPPAS